MDAANYAATHIHVTLARNEALLSDPARALKEVFQRTDAMFLRKAKREVNAFKSLISFKLVIPKKAAFSC